MRVAIIGTRSPAPEMKEFIINIASKLVQKGHIVQTGGAEGVDNLAMIGASSVNPSRLHVFLPWASYNKEIIPSGSNITVYSQYKHPEWLESVKKHHPAYDRLSRGAISLHARNYGIIESADRVIALPSNKIGGGGTGQGMRLAQSLGIKLFDLTQEDDYRKWYKYLTKEEMK